MSENFPARYDGFGALDAGINAQPNHGVESSTNPYGLARNQCANAINCTFRGGQGATHRPPWMRRTLQFQTTDAMTGFGPNQLWQGWATHNGERDLMVVAIGGRQYTVDPANGFNVREMTLPGDPNPSTFNYNWFVQAGPFTVIQDGSSRPLIFDGSTLRRARDNEIKAGTVLAYSQGRIWYARNDPYGRTTLFRATDLIGNRSTGTAQYNYQDSVLLETENTFLNEGGDFSARSDMGEIRAMVVPRMLDKSLGQGPLQVFSERGAISVNAPVDRATWKDVTYPIETESQLDYGALGARAAVNVNGDIIYRGIEGFISFKAARADFQSWINTPISNEVDDLIADDPEQLLFYGSAVLFDGRVVATTMPRPTSNGIVHDGLVALDMNLVSTLRKRAPAAWEGRWTGLAILQIDKGTFDGVERCFAFTRAIDGRIELWELLPSATTEIRDNGETPIVWSFETPAYDCSRPEDQKQLETAAFWQSDIRETVEFLVQWRPDNYPCYLDWHAWSECAPVRQCASDFPNRCMPLRNLRPQYRAKVRLPQPPDICDEVTRSNLRRGYEFQMRIQVTGHAVIRKVRLAATDVPEPFLDGCPLVGPCLPLECCSPDPLVYSTAPYRDGGSAGTDQTPYPVLSYPAPPHDYPYFPPPGSPGSCPECDVVNPPPTPPEPVAPPTVTFPGLPPVVLLPDPNLPPLVGPTFAFFGMWTDPTRPMTLEAGNVLEPPDGLTDGTLKTWATQVWQQFSDYVVANSVAVTAAQIQVFNAGGGIGGGASRRWFADPLFQSGTYVNSYGLQWVLMILYTIA